MPGRCSPQVLTRTFVEANGKATSDTTKINPRSDVSWDAGVCISNIGSHSDRRQHDAETVDTPADDYGCIVEMVLQGKPRQNEAADVKWRGAIQNVSVKDKKVSRSFP